MKKILNLIALVCFVFLNVDAQIMDSLLLPATTKSIYISKDEYEKISTKNAMYKGKVAVPTDTVMVLQLVCDTGFISEMKGIYYMMIVQPNKDRDSSLRIGKAVNHYPECWWQYGYEVSVNMHYYLASGEEKLFPVQTWYLDADKQPLKKSIIIWQSIKLN